MLNYLLTVYCLGSLRRVLLCYIIYCRYIVWGSLRSTLHDDDDDYVTLFIDELCLGESQENSSTLHYLLTVYCLGEP